MRALTVTTFLTLDGVAQAPGGPEEDPTNGFAFGGWQAPLIDDVVGEWVWAGMQGLDALLLGRRTYDIFAAYWPYQEASDIGRKFDAVTKHVATRSPDTLGWRNSRGLGPDVVASLRELKAEDGAPLVTQGSTELIQTLLANDLIDELRLVVAPIVLGKGKRLFGDGAIPAAFRLTRFAATPGGVLIASYERAGDVRTGSFAMEQPTEAELERRRKLSQG